jgi:hypothetical protein
MLGMRRDGSAALLTFTRRSDLPLGHVVQAAWATVGVSENVVSSTSGVDAVEARWTSSGTGFMRVEYAVP